MFGSWATQKFRTTQKGICPLCLTQETEIVLFHTHLSWVFLSLCPRIFCGGNPKHLGSQFSASAIRDSNDKLRIRLVSQVSGKQEPSPAKTIRLLRMWATILRYCCVKQSTFPHRSPLFSLVTDYRTNHSNSLSGKQITEGI